MGPLKSGDTSAEPLLSASRPSRTARRELGERRARPLPRLAVLTLALMTAASCAEARNEPIVGMPDDAGGSGPRRSEDGGAPLDLGAPDVTCEPGKHACEGTCVSDDDVASCGTRCTPCPAPQGGTATCDQTVCGATCPAGLRVCQGRCVAAEEPCGGCPTGRNPCFGACVDPTSLEACGSSCTVCPEDPNGTSSCNGDTCRLDCKAGYHRCGDKCVSNDDPLNCGTSCLACPSGGGTPTCDGTKCGLLCQSPKIKCGGACIDGSLCCTNDKPGCAAEQACREGQCAPCRTSGSCSTSNPCKSGTYQCNDGEESCRETNKANGTTCGSALACRSGECVQCRSSGSCSNNPCKNSTYECNDGNESCQETGNKADNTDCGGGRVCRSGSCTELKNNGTGCGNGDECKSGNCVGSTCCSSGQCNIGNGTGTCSSGDCRVLSCDRGFFESANACRPCNTNDRCGSSCQRCDSPLTCQGGSCQCSGGRSPCGNACVNFSNDPRNCGRCGESCPANGGTATCNGGRCDVNCGNKLKCDGRCVNSDDANCGRCGTTCSGDTACARGACRLVDGLGCDVRRNDECVNVCVGFCLNSGNVCRSNGDCTTGPDDECLPDGECRRG